MTDTAHLHATSVASTRLRCVSSTTDEMVFHEHTAGLCHWLPGPKLDQAFTKV